MGDAKDPEKILAAKVQADEKELQADKAELAKEEAVVKSLDIAIKKERELAFSDQIALNKASDAYFRALKSGDKKLASELRTKIKALESKYDVEEKLVKDLTAKEEKEVQVENFQRNKVKSNVYALKLPCVRTTK